MSIIKPPALEPGDTIGVFSPSSPATHFAPKRTARAVAFLKNQGFRVCMGELSGECDFWRSGSIQDRANELNALIRNPDVRCIISSIGGTNSNSLLPYIDYDALRADPKIFCGYSDVTALHAAIANNTGLITFYGPALTASFGEFEPLVSQTLQAFLDVVTTRTTYPFTLPNPTHWTEERIDWETQDRAKSLTQNTLITVTPGQHTGRLIGGNLNTLGGVWGTPYAPDIRSGDILLIEDSLKDAAVMERLFSRLLLAGTFEKIGGLILGKHEGFDDCGSARTPLDILLEVMRGKPTFPMLAEYDCAHTHPMITLPLGAQIKLDATAQHIIIEEACVR